MFGYFWPIQLLRKLILSKKIVQDPPIPDIFSVPRFQIFWASIPRFVGPLFPDSRCWFTPPPPWWCQMSHTKKNFGLLFQKISLGTQESFCKVSDLLDTCVNNCTCIFTRHQPRLFLKALLVYYYVGVWWTIHSHFCVSLMKITNQIVLIDKIESNAHDKCMF